MRAYAYLALLSAVTIGAAVVCAMFALVVDPYRLYDSPNFLGRTDLKPQIYREAAITKAHQLERIGPKTLLLGNSRVEIGFDPESSHWPAELLPVFNAAMAGRDLFIESRMFQHAEAVGPLDTVIIGLDFPDFLDEPSSPSTPLSPPGPDEKRLLVDRDNHPNADRRIQLWRDRIATTLSVDALFDSISTVLDQNPQTTTTMTPFGFNPLNEYRAYVQRSGYHVLFAQKMAIYADQYSRYPKPDFVNPTMFSEFRLLVSLVRDALRQNCRVILFIHPYHADYLELLNRIGFWNRFESWKRALVTVVDSEADTKENAVTLLDFSGYNQFTTESVRTTGDTTAQMHWYWEPGHYKRELGDQMLDRMFHHGTDFGRVLTTAKVEASIAAIRQERELYESRARDPGTRPSARTP